MVADPDNRLLYSLENLPLLTKNQDLRLTYLELDLISRALFYYVSGDAF